MFQLEMLEPRVLLSADGVSVDAGVSDQPDVSISDADDVVMVEMGDAAVNTPFSDSEPLAGVDILDLGDYEELVLIEENDPAEPASTEDRVLVERASNETSVLVQTGEFNRKSLSRVESTSSVIVSQLSQTLLVDLPPPLGSISSQTSQQISGGFQSQAIQHDPISSGEAQAIRNGLSEVVEWLSTVDSFELFDQVIPILNQSLGQLFDFGAVMQQGLVGPILDFFVGDANPETQELIEFLQGVSGTYDTLSISTIPMDVVGERLDSPSTLTFSLPVTGNRTLIDFPLDLGSLGEESGVTLGAAALADLVLDFGFDFTFGLDLT